MKRDDFKPRDFSAELAAAGVVVSEADVRAWTPEQRREALRYAEAVAVARGPRPVFFPAPPSPPSPRERMVGAVAIGTVDAWRELMEDARDEQVDAWISFEEICDDLVSLLEPLRESTDERARAAAAAASPHVSTLREQARSYTLRSLAAVRTAHRDMRKQIREAFE